MTTTERFNYNSSTKNKKRAKDNLKFAFSYALDELFKNNLKDEDGKKVQSYEQLFSAVAYIANKYVFKNSKIFVSSAPIFMRFLKIYEVYYLIKIFVIENEALHDFIKKHGGFTDDETLKHPLSLIKIKPNVEADISSFDYYNIVGYDELAGFSQEDYDKQSKFNQENFDEQADFSQENSNNEETHNAQNTINKIEHQDLDDSDQSNKIKGSNVSSSLQKMSMF